VDKPPDHTAEQADICCKLRVMIPQRSKRPSIARVIEQLNPLADIPPPQSATLGLHTVARKPLLISRRTERRRLSWPEK